ncbi:MULTISPECIES: class I SAM-dependent methyltransferase [unclassified Tychonema]|uniref:class I SAM-dependent methyltransferase n=1 Tax=unclassified Tychonema TaxID=2642144 RepID=UPI001D146094|nr:MULTISPECIES: class I SAM-dependent methyltransferase [unclassified Tychonema]
MFKIELEYPTSSSNKPRYTKSQPNKYISQAVESNDEVYRRVLQNFPKYFHQLANIDVDSNEDAREPLYINPYFPAFDSISLYCLIAELKPNIYIEVGSGNSTKFARRAIRDNNLKTQIISIDPYPRSEIDDICDRVIRQPVEEIDLNIFENLQKNDIVFIDNSHRCFMNSDVTICFLDIMPRLNPGVYLQIHDIFWPFDYPESWQERYYNEQYLLGTLLANGLNDYEIVLPVYYASLHPELSSILSSLWSADEKFDRVYKHGGSFWMRRKLANQDYEQIGESENERSTAIIQANYNQPVPLKDEVFLPTNNHRDKENIAILNDSFIQPSKINDATFLQETAHLSHQDFVQAVYRTYMLRDSDVQGYHHFFSVLTERKCTRQQVISTIRESAEFKAQELKFKLKGFDYSKYPRRLNLGCGWDIKQGYLNVDLHDFGKPDLVADIRHLDLLPSGYYDEIIAQDCLEHMPRCDTQPVLTGWGRLLKQGGILKIRTTSLIDLLELFKSEKHQSVEAQKLLVQFLYGSQACEGDWHLTGFTKTLMTHYLEEAGLGNIEYQVVSDWLMDVTAEKTIN